MKPKDTRYLNGERPDRKAPTYHDLSITDVVSKHYAANGRLVTACGLKIERNSYANHVEHSNRGDPTCLKCQRVMKLAKLMDPAAMVAMSEDDSPHALSTATRALEDAQVLCEQLPPGFTPRVWHNGGWHGEACFEENDSTLVTVHAERYGGKGFGAQVRHTRHIAHEQKTPKAALKYVIDSFKAEAAATIIDLTHLGNMLTQVAP